MCTRCEQTTTKKDIHTIYTANIIRVQLYKTQTTEIVYTHSHAEATLASRVDVHVTINVRIVKAGIKAVDGCGLGNRGFLMRNGCLERHNYANDGKKEDREEGTSHGSL